MKLQIDSQQQAGFKRRRSWSIGGSKGSQLNVREVCDTLHNTYTNTQRSNKCTLPDGWSDHTYFSTFISTTSTSFAIRRCAALASTSTTTSIADKDSEKKEEIWGHQVSKETCIMRSMHKSNARWKLTPAYYSHRCNPQTALNPSGFFSGYLGVYFLLVQHFSIIHRQQLTVVVLNWSITQS